MSVMKLWEPSEVHEFKGQPISIDLYFTHAQSAEQCSNELVGEMDLSWVVV